MKSLLSVRCRPALCSKPVPLGNDSCQRLLLFRSELEIPGDHGAAKHRRNALPLQFDLPESLELVPREVVTQPFELCLVDCPPLGHYRGARLAAQGQGSTCELIDRVLSSQDLCPFES